MNGSQSDKDEKIRALQFVQQLKVSKFILLFCGYQRNNIDNTDCSCKEW